MMGRSFYRVEIIMDCPLPGNVERCVRFNDNGVLYNLLPYTGRAGFAGAFTDPTADPPAEKKIIASPKLLLIMNSKLIPT